LKERWITVILGPFKKKVSHIYIAVAIGPHLKAR